VVEISQNAMPVVVLDLPHVWTAWLRHTLAAVDEIVIVAEPDLANLRNAKNLADTLKGLRPAERAPCLVLNQVNMPRRPEIAPDDFASSIDCQLLGCIGFDAALFGTAANNGQMIAEVAATNKINDIYRSIGMHVTGRQVGQAGSRSTGLRLGSLFKKRA